VNAFDDPPGAVVPDIVETTDLRTGPELHAALLAVLPLVGSWAGHGKGLTPQDQEDFHYAQRVSFSHDGRPFLSYSAHAWLTDAEGGVIRPAFREHGFLRMSAGPDELELVMSSAAGIVSVFGGIAGDQRWEFASSAVGFTPTAKPTAGDRRLYALVGTTLAYVQELALDAGEFRPHLQAELSRTADPR
jgi:hypothetical protein